MFLGYCAPNHLPVKRVGDPDYFLCEHGKVERYVEFVGVQHLSYSPNTAQVTEDVRWVEYERVKATVEML